MLHAGALYFFEPRACPIFPLYKAELQSLTNWAGALYTCMHGAAVAVPHQQQQ